MGDEQITPFNLLLRCHSVAVPRKSTDVITCLSLCEALTVNCKGRSQPIVTRVPCTIQNGISRGLCWPIQHNRSVHPLHLEPLLPKEHVAYTPTSYSQSYRMVPRIYKSGQGEDNPSQVRVASSHILLGRGFQPSQTGRTNMHPNLQALTQLPPPSERTIHGDIPIYYLQVPAHCVAKIRGPDTPDPPLYVVLSLAVYSAYFVACNSWGADQGHPDADGHHTWRLLFENGSVIYIRSQPVPETGPGTVPALLSTISY